MLVRLPDNGQGKAILHSAFMPGHAACHETSAVQLHSAISKAHLICVVHCRATRQLIDDSTGWQWAEAAEGYLHPAFISQVTPLNVHGVPIQRALRHAPLSYADLF